MSFLAVKALLAADGAAVLPNGLVQLDAVDYLACFGEVRPVALHNPRRFVPLHVNLASDVMFVPNLTVVLRL